MDANFAKVAAFGKGISYVGTGKPQRACARKQVEKC